MTNAFSRAAAETNALAKATPQRMPVPGREAQMVQMESGGWGFAASDEVTLDRFLMLGADGGTFYVGEADLATKMTGTLKDMIHRSGEWVVTHTAELIKAGRVWKPEHAVFVLAACFAYGSNKTKELARANFREVVRTASHLFTWAEAFRALYGKVPGSGSSQRKAIANWYLSQPIDKLTYQVLKYQTRAGWSHKDLLRLSHTHPDTLEQSGLFRWLVGKATADEVGNPMLKAFARLRSKDAAISKDKIGKLIREFGLSWEMVPNEHFESVEVWEALAESMPPHAMLRNLARLTANGMLAKSTKLGELFRAKLSNAEALRKARVHPFAILLAAWMYDKGMGFRGNLKWTPIPWVQQLLTKALDTAFGTVESTGKKFYVAVDVSGSMTWGNVHGIPDMRPCELGAIMAWVTVKSEPNVVVRGVDGNIHMSKLHGGMSYRESCRSAFSFNGGTTNLELIFRDALNLPAHERPEVFVLYTDNQSHYGQRHVFQGLADYRKRTGINAKFIAVSVQQNAASLCDPDDVRSLDIVGFDASCAQLISRFAAEDVAASVGAKKPDADTTGGKVSSCKKHKAYKAIRFPTSGCPDCVRMYREKHKE